MLKRASAERVEELEGVVVVERVRDSAEVSSTNGKGCFLLTGLLAVSSLLLLLLLVVPLLSPARCTFFFKYTSRSSILANCLACILSQSIVFLFGAAFAVVVVEVEEDVVVFALLLLVTGAVGRFVVRTLWFAVIFSFTFSFFCSLVIVGTNRLSDSHRASERLNLL